MPNPRIILEQPSFLHTFAGDVRHGLSLPQKQIAPVFLYDELGTALFDSICAMPWYHLRRAEVELLQENAHAIASALRKPVRVIELGPGNGEKIEPVIKALENIQPRVDVDFIDVSANALTQAMQRFTQSRKVFARYHIGVFEECLDSALAGPTIERRLVVCLGSNLGNLAPSAAEDFLMEIRQRLRPGDGILLGADLIKPEDELMLAYADPVGVTAAFNKNLLSRMNRELGADFNLEHFKHEACWNAQEARVEMYLVSLRKQSVRIPGAGITVEFHEGETIWTECSHKYTRESLDAMLRSCGFVLKDVWENRNYGFLDALYWLPPLSLVDA